MNNRLTKQSLFANTVLCGACGLTLFALIYISLRQGVSQSEYIGLFYLFSCLAFLFYGVSLFLNQEWKTKLALVTIALGSSVYFAEMILAFRASLRRPEQTQTLYDTRSKYELIQDLRNQGIDAWPNIPPSEFVASGGLKTKDHTVIYPLAGISGKTTVFCNESGDYAIYKSDEYGFNNPLNLHHIGKVDIVLLGDSFTHGACVPQGDNPAAQLRSMGLRTLNLGYAGNDPLLELATISEYVEHLKPKIVFWLYYEGNDLHELTQRVHIKGLTNYLKSDYSQTLRERQREIDALLEQYVDPIYRRIRTVNTTELWRIITLFYVRDLLRLTAPSSTKAMPCEFKVILEKAKVRIENWGGMMYVVYLPEWWRFANGRQDDENYRGSIMTFYSQSSFNCFGHES